MFHMVVTLDVSKLSGWLNLAAVCQESKERHTMRGEVRPGGGRRRARGARSVQGRGLNCRLGAGHGEERTSNMRPMFMTLEVSKLSGWLNALANCRESKGGHTVRCEVWPLRREAAGDRDARSVQGRARLQIGGRPRGGAHPEYGVHGRDAGRVEAQRLVEPRRVLPRVERKAYGAGRGAAREMGGGGRPRCTQRAGRGGCGCRLVAGHGVERTKNMPIMSVTLDVSKLSGWLNADACCRESKGGHTVRGGVRASRLTADGGDGVQRAAEARLQIGGRTGVERTMNILCMSVTPEVCQLEMSALKFVMV
eukprot:scaffold54860_cov49-Phaeocystis_antarctica.AAC.2